MARQTIYTVGGTVQAGGGIYIKRKADDELLELCKQGEFAFILSSRQVGKSSLMVHTAQALAADNICSVIIDLSALGTSVTADEWYLGILNEIHSSLNLETDIFGWWQQYNQLGPSQRLTNFFKDVLLKEVKEQVVLFFDEIDSTLSIPFSDDFYVALRAVYNARSTTPDFKRLSFVLVGVAAPSDLISDNRRTPFNIGRRVEVKDFTLAEALPLAQGLGQQAEKVLAWVLQYSGGHPYLTQRLCADLANSKEIIDEQTVANTVERLFTGEQGKQDNNLQFVRDMLSKRSPDVERVLSIYKDVRSGKNVLDDERSIAKAHLKLSGLVRSEQGFLRARNEIYNSVFNLQWIRENTPKNWQRTAVISLSAVLGIFVLIALIVFANDYWIGTKIDHHVKDFYFAKSPRQRLSDLAEIYKQKGILSNKDSALTASELFYGGLSTAQDQLALFDAYGMDQDPVLQNDMVFVISHLYITVANVDPEEDNTELLQAMLNAVSNIPDNPIAASLKDEITAWIAGRKSFSSGDVDGALSNYNDAYSLNPGNQAILYERAKVYIKRAEYTNALSDLEAAINAAKQSAPDIATPTPTAGSLLGTVTLSSITAQPGETGLAQTSVPTQINTTPTGVLTPTLPLTPTPTVITPPTSPSTSPKKYESNFTTLIDVVNAVRTLIENTPQLRIAMQSNGQNAYTNLQSFGFVPIILTPTKVPTPLTPKMVSTVLTPTKESVLGVVPFVSPNNPELLNPVFGWQAGDSPTNNYDLVSFPNALTLTAAGRMDQWAGKDSAPLIFYPVIGNFETQVKVVSNPIRGSEFAALGVRSSSDRNTWLRLGSVYGVPSAGSKPERRVVIDIDKAGIGNQISFARYPTETVYLKIQRDGQAFNFLYSSDGDTWVILRQNYVSELPTDVVIFLMVGCWGNNGTSAQFYDFRVLSK